MKYQNAVIFIFLVVVQVKSQEFKNWSEWSQCSASCGVGSQQRKRECADGRCAQQETRGCRIKTCENGGPATSGSQFKEWGEWTRCSKTCGSGLQERKRECTDGTCVQSQKKTCLLSSCGGEDSTKWPEWSACSATCGQGVATRIRQCPEGNCRQKQTKTCYEKDCSTVNGTTEYENWQAWSSCSVTCGPGTKSRIRLCKNADCRETEVGSCRFKSCPGKPKIVPGKWQKWSPCSATCGPGQRKRKRTCKVGVCEQTQTENCSVKNCPGRGKDKREYKQWGVWGPCSKTCGAGIHKRKRRCVVGLCEEIMTKTCFKPACKGGGTSYTPWGAWNECSATCGNGERQRIRNCKPPARCVQTQSQTCFLAACGSIGLPTTSPDDRFHFWEAWSPCSVTCGIGIETRRRRCKVGGCVEIAERSCRKNRCVGEPITEYGPWSSWSKCSATCGAGEAKSSRSYPDGTSVQEKLKYCNNGRCPTPDLDKYGKWMEWAGCSVTCGTGVQTRVRFCKVGDCQDTETTSCKKEDCVPTILPEKYGDWVEWSECDRTCGFGFSYRKRYCNIGVCEQTATKSCRLRACPTDYTEWGKWGPCSVTCGSGISKRKRYCTVGSCEEEQQTTCDMEKCGDGWEDWAEWQGCHKTCGGGFDYRIRRCKERLPSKNCPGDDYDFKRCNTQSCTAGTWGEWSEWGDCPVTCGTGIMTRSRVCDGERCEGNDRDAKACNSNDCMKIEWSKWSKWSACSVTCGKGEREKHRTCIGGKQWDGGCLGSTLTKEVCEEEPCVKAKWSQWSPYRECSVTCGRGRSVRERICIDGSPGDPGCSGKTTSHISCNLGQCKIAKWTKWSAWKTCSVTCGEGTTSRSRECTNGEVGDRGCIGKAEATKSCKKGKCPANGKWSNWGKWNECTVSCGIGSISRYRTCKGDKNGCLGRDKEQKICTQKDCNAAWGKWSDWSACSASCGTGLTLRIRLCEGGSIGDEGCEEGGQESKECKIMDCNGGPTIPTTEETAIWSEWSHWSICPVTCGSGTQSRSRDCTVSGKCDGSSEDAQLCNIAECPTPKKGHWSKWDKWEACPVPCGPGISRRSRSCIDGEVGQSGCPGRRTQHRRCKKADCQWSDWGEYEICSVTCGKGTRSRSRLCAGGAMENSKCVGTAIDVVECSKPDCPYDPDTECPEVAKLPYSSAQASTDSPYKVGAKLTFSCFSGYKTKGDKKITCQADGRWSGPVPFCAENYCTKYLEQVDVGQTCKMECQADDDCKRQTSKCLCDGSCGMSCVDPDGECEPLSLPENGYIVGDKRTYGHTVTYGCNEGYILSPKTTRVCRSDGRWTGMTPKCWAYNTPGLAGDVGNLEPRKALRRVIAGDDANVGAWPWQALLIFNERNMVHRSMQSRLGGGSVINNKWILTAAHVADATEDWPEEVIIGLGVTKVPKDDNPLPSYAQFFRPKSIIKHPKYNPKNYDYDVALVKVGERLKIDGERFVTDKDGKEEIIFNKYVRPVSLPCISSCDIKGKNSSEYGVNVKTFEKSTCTQHGKSLKVADWVVVTGYGDTTKNTLILHSIDVARTLQQAKLNLLRSNECVDGMKRIQLEHKTAKYTSRMICTGSDEGKDACQGDSGGPLVKRVTNSEGDVCWIQVGIISWGWGCANKDKNDVQYPGYYADTSVLMSWIVNTMQED